jgi:hypothetical protein
MDFSNPSPPGVSPASDNVLIVGCVTTGPATPGVKRYLFERVTLNCTQITAPQNPSRLPTPLHVDKLMQMMLEDGFCAVASAITVVPNPDRSPDSTVHSHVCVDGLHRLNALQKLSADPAQMSRFLHVPVIILRREDNSPILGIEILQLSSNFNTMSHLVSPQTLTDQISACDSFLKEAKYTTVPSRNNHNYFAVQDKDSNVLPIETVAKTILDANVLGQ